MATRVSLGDVNWMAEEVELVHFPQPLQRYGTEAEVARSQRQGTTPYTVANLTELGIIPDANDIRGVDLMTGYVFSQGCTSRIPNFLGLPELVINQASMSDDENISEDNAAKQRGYWETTSVGSSVGEQAYYAEGLRFFKLNQSTGAMEVAQCNVDSGGADEVLPGTVTCLRELVVGGSRVLAMGLRNYGVVYTSDPDASTVVWTTYIGFNADGYMNAMKFMQQLGPGVNVFQGEVNGVNGHWWASGADSAPVTLRPLVNNATRSEFDPNAVVQDTGWVAPFDARNAVIGGLAVTVYTASPIISNISNVLASDDQRATYSVNSPVLATTQAQGIFTYYDFRDTFPALGRRVGTEVSIERMETDAAVNAFDADVVLGAVGSITYYDPTTPSLGANRQAHVYTPLSVNKAATTTEWPTTEAAATYGGSADLWGWDGSAAEIRSPNVGLFHRWIQAQVAAQNSGVDQYLMKHYFIEPGFMLTVPTGAIQCNDDPTRPNGFTVLAPPANEEAAYTLPLEQWDIECFWDAEGERVTMALSQPNEGLVNTHHAAPLLSGVLFTGGLTPGPGTELFFRDSGGLLYDYAFPKRYGTYTPKIAWIIPVGGLWAALGVVMYNDSSTVVDFQIWYFNGETLRYYADTPLTSVTDHPSSGNMTISAVPIYYGTVAINPLLSFIYTVFPNGSDTAVRREHIHTDLSADPRLDNPSWQKQARFVSGTENARLQTRLARMNYGPTDALKDLTEIYLESVQVDNNAAYGSVVVKVDSEGDTTLATPNVENTFTTGNTTYQVPNAHAYNDLIVQIEIGHQTNSAETPNALPFVLNTEQSWEPISVYRVKTSLTGLLQEGHKSIRDFRDRLLAQNRTKQSQRFTSVIDGNVSGKDGEKLARFLYIEDAKGRPITSLQLDMKEPFYVLLKEVPGVLS